MSFPHRRLHITAEVDPRIPSEHLAGIARELDRLANSAINDGFPLWAAKASRRAAELRELMRRSGR